MGKINRQFMKRLRELEADTEHWESLTAESEELVELRASIGMQTNRSMNRKYVDAVALEKARIEKGYSQPELSKRVGRNQQWYKDGIYKGFFTKTGAIDLGKALGLKEDDFIINNE